ncbi:protein moonraker-like isoform X2 [Patiria miniata]|uniref:Protein moonraker n=1 Tax=Patiria miniata TaxID=46514 RepID=A0A914BFC7_PATMI|nr:protein moonraker-like isoform X2 [Patiria miniata]
MFHQNQLQFNLDVPSLPGNLAARYRHPGPLVIEKLGGGTTNAESAPEKPKDPPVKFTTISEDRLSTAVRLARLDLKNIASKSQTPDINKLSRQEPRAASQQRQEAAKKDWEDAEEDPRRAARAAEHASRSARLLYSLQQQVREIQEELDKLGPGKVRHTKKSRALNRLAAAHRGAVRALQSFLHHLPSEIDHRSGLPPHYQELALLIRQLSLCCSQLDVEESGIPEGVLNILEQAKDFQDALSQQISSPPRPKANPVPQPHASPRRRLAFETNTVRVPHGKPAPRATVSKNLRVDQRYASPMALNPHHYRVRETPERDTDPPRATTRGTSHTTPHATPGPATVERLRQTVVNNKATPGSPERNAALRAGLEALLRAGGHAQGPAHSTQPATKMLQQQPAGRARKQPAVNGFKAPSKSLILPAKLKAARERLQRARTIPRDAHFIQETLASKLKHRDPAGQTGTADPAARPQDDGAAKPAWTPPGSPRSFHKVSPRARRVSVSSENEDGSVIDWEHSPRRRKVNFNLEEESQDKKDPRREGERRLDPDLMEREIARQAWLDREAVKQLKHLDRGVEADGHPPVPPHWLEEVEQALTDRLRPLIDKAEATAKEQERIQNSTTQSLHHQLSQRAAQATSNNAELLSDLLLDDILADTALEFHRIERDEQLDQQARQLVEAPTVEGMLQSLEKMELMEDEIRRRWKRVEYIEQEELGGKSIPHREAKWMMGTPLDGEFLESFPGDIPTSHTSMQFTKSRPRDTNRSHPSVSTARPLYDMNIPARTNASIHPTLGGDDGDNGVRPPAGNDVQIIEMDSRENATEPIGDTPGTTVDQTHHMNILHTLLDNKSNVAAAVRPGTVLGSKESGTRPVLNRPRFPLFIPLDTMSRIRDHRVRFQHHLKRTSHWAYGTFDPWRLVEEVSDEIVSEIIKDVSSEVGDIMGHCVDDLYKAEFDMT